MNEEEIIRELEYFKANGEPISVSSKMLMELYDLYNQENEKNKKLEEVIDMMAEDLQKYTTIRYAEDTKLMNGNYLMIMPELIKSYYFKKTRGEENETN